MVSRGADTNIPPSALYGGGPYDGHAIAQINAYAAPADSLVRYKGGAYDGHALARFISYSAPAGATIRHSGGAYDGHAYAQLNTFAPPADALARFSGSSRDGAAMAERDTFDLMAFNARYAGGAYDGGALATAGPYFNPLNFDADGDGIPDWWVVVYYRTVFGPPAAADGDADGSTTREEYIADTDPRDPASRFEIRNLAVTNAASIVFNSSSNRLYMLEFRTNAQPETWAQVPGDPQRYGIGGLDSFSESAGATSRLYRVRVSLP